MTVVDEHAAAAAGQGRGPIRSWVGSVVVTAAVAVVFSFMATAQVPRTTSETPRTPEGRADLQGIWQTMNTAAWDILDHGARLGVPAGQSVVEGGEIPYQPWARAQQEENFENRLTADPVAQCFLPGVPRITYMPFPFEIFQTPNYVAIVYEYVHATRIIYTNGSSHPEGIEFFMGDSRGRWEGDTLVVDVTNLSAETWFDRAGNFHSDALHVVERYTPIGRHAIRYEATIEDPNVFTRPWTMSMILYRHREKNFQLLEYECHAYAYEEGEEPEAEFPAVQGR